jgi:Tfp pilus assembly protein PilF
MNESKAIMSLLELEQQAFKLRDEGEITDAIVLLQELLEREPSWEHGYGAFLLATCLEDTNQITQAKKYYQIALSYTSEDRIILGSYASFLYLHGSALEAYDAFKELLRILLQEEISDAEDTKKILEELEAKINS